MKKTFLSLLSIIVVLLVVGAAVSGCKKEKIEEPEPPQEETESFDMKITPRSMKLLLDSAATIVAKITPDGLEDVEISYKSSNSTIASVNKRGRVSGVGVGSATITVTATYGEETVTRKCNVTVFKDTLGIAAKEYTVFVGENVLLEAKMASGRNVEVAWKSLSTDIAMIDKDGQVFARATGDAKIVASTTYDKQLLTDTCIVHVTEVIKISEETMELPYIGATKELSCNVSAAEWTTHDASIVSISGEGAKRTIKGLAEGNTFVVVSYAGKRDSCAVRVGNPPLQITPEGESVNLAKDDTLTLTCGYEAKWAIESGSSYVKLLDQNSKTCRVAGLAQGDAVVSASFGSLKDSKTIHVTYEELRITPAGPLSLEATHEQVFRSNLNNVKWEIVSGSELVKMDMANNKVIAKVGEGQAVLKATVGKQSQTIEVNVYMQAMTVTPSSITGAPWVDYFDLECNYFDLYGVEATMWCDENVITAANLINGEANATRETVEGKCKLRINALYDVRSATTPITFKYGDKTAIVTANISLPALTVTPSSVNKAYKSGDLLDFDTNYSQIYNQGGISNTLINPSPSDFLEEVIVLHGLRYRVKKPGTATLRVTQRGQTVDVPIVIR